MPIVLENVTVSYRRLPAVHHVSVAFDEGEAWAVCGPNGAGKSTLLKAIMGLEKCDTGQVCHQGLHPQEIAYLPQQSETDRTQAMSVFELAATGLWYEIGFFGGISAAQRVRVHDALQRVGMADYADRLILQLSNGQFQRVLFARMLVQNAKFLLLDEPFNAIDAQTTAALLAILDECRADGQTVIAVLHDYAQVRAHFPQTVLLAREKIAAGATAEVLNQANLARAGAFRQDIFDATEWCEETAGNDE